MFFIFKFLKQIPDAYFVLKMEIDMAMYIDISYVFIGGRENKNRNVEKVFLLGSSNLLT